MNLYSANQKKAVVNVVICNWPSPFHQMKQFKTEKSGKIFS